MDSEHVFSSGFNERYNLVTRKLIRLLSQDSEASISKISKQIGMSRETTRNRLRKIESEFGINYTIEIDGEALNLADPHLIAVKFDSKPDFDKITSMLEKSYIPQLAVSIKGDYSMVICAIATSSREYAHWDKGMQIALSEYGADWRSSEVVHRQLGFFPFRNELIDRLQIAQKHKDILKALNANSRTSFHALSKQIGMHPNTLVYNRNKLIAMGYINRFTITMSKPRDVSLMSFFAKYRPRAGYEDASAQARQAFMSDDENSLISRYVLCAPLIGSYDFFTIGAFDDTETAHKRDVEYHRNLFKKQGIQMVCGEVDRVLMGRLPLRSVDTRKEYSTIKWTSDVAPQ
jgi:DNA-binding Lrp family transcriptional regulator